MKKIILSLATVALFATTANAQIKQGVYASVNFGYNMATNNSSNLYYGDGSLDFANYNEVSGFGDTAEAAKLSLGKGLNFTGTFGYMFTKNIGTELGLGYVMGADNKANYSYNNATIGFTASQESILKTNQFQIKPTLIFAAGYEKINPYAKLGMVMGMGKTTYNTDYRNSNGDTNVSETELTGGMMIGLRASAGISYALGNKLSLFAELTSVSGNVKPKKGTITKAINNGVDVLPTYTYNDTNIEFVDTYTNNGPETDAETHKLLRPSFNASTLGLNIGMTYNF